MSISQLLTTLGMDDWHTYDWNGCAILFDEEIEQTFFLPTTFFPNIARFRHTTDFFS
jgi:hypothetical protein